MMWEDVVGSLRPYLNAILIGFGGFVIAFIFSQVVRRLLSRPMGEGGSRFLGSLVALGVGIWTSNQNFVGGNYGELQAVDSRWIDIGVSAACDLPRAVICVAY